MDPRGGGRRGHGAQRRLVVVVGALCPLLLRRWKIDPALASGPVTTTLADVSGFALTLAFVAWAH